MSSATLARHRATAFGYAIPIGVLGGLIGLGGAEFRLPVLVGPLGYPARRAVPLNLVVSLITVITSLIIRGNTLSLAPLTPFLLPMTTMIVGAMITAFIGTALVGRLTNERLEHTILVLLLAIGAALIVESFLPQQTAALIPAAHGWRIGSGILFGLAIGLVSSLLGVAGGELIIPTMLFAFGADVKTAGTASLCISFPTVLVGVLRYIRQGALVERRVFSDTVVPMGIGSVIGALIGGAFIGIAPATVLKFGLGIILIVSATRSFLRHRSLHARHTA